MENDALEIQDYLSLGYQCFYVQEGATQVTISPINGAVMRIEMK